MATSPFDVLGIAARFDVDLKALEARYRDLSRALHPDRFVGKPKEERRLALSRAIEVNAAYRVVRDPVKRAEALIRALPNAPELEEGKEPPASPALLMEILETREALAEAAQRKDIPAVRALEQLMRTRRQKVIEDLGKLFHRISEDPTAMNAAIASLGELRYVSRFLDEVSAFDDALLDGASGAN